MENIEQIWEGRAGLARTYWGWGVASSIPWAIALSLVTHGSPAAIVLVLALAVYSFVLNIGIWRAANAYTGPVIWSALAKVSAAIGLCLRPLLQRPLLSGLLVELENQLAFLAANRRRHPPLDLLAKSGGKKAL